MNSDRCLALVDRVAEAPDAIDRLRSFVLNLAVRGKLVPQDSVDESASVLLERMANERHRQIEAGEIRKPRSFPNEGVQYATFEVPGTWCWCRLDAIGAIIGGGTPSSADMESFAKPGEGIAWLTPADLGRHADLYIERGARDLSEEGLRASSATLMPTGTVLFTSRAPIGYVAIAGNEISTNQGFKSIVPYVRESSRFVAVLMQAFAPLIAAHAPGTTFKEVSGKAVAGVRIPLPPLSEQHRIVAKVDELMALCDELEASHKQREETRDHLTKACLTRLTAMDTDDETFRSHARFSINALPALTARAEQVKHFRHTIRDLAVRGKLVKQNGNEGPGLELRSRSQTGQQNLRKQAKRAEYTEYRFPIPPSWTWTTLEELIVAGPRNGLSPRPSTREDAPRAITLTATTAGVFDAAQFKRVEADIGPDSEFWLQPNDLLFQRGNTREYVGMAAVYNGPPETFIFPDLIIRVRISPEVNLQFVHLACTSPPIRNYFSQEAVGAQKTMPKINQAILLATPIPLPPLMEQQRIITKVDELMSLCDRLESSLTSADNTRGKLLESLLQEALAPAESGREESEALREDSTKEKGFRGTASIK